MRFALMLLVCIALTACVRKAPVYAEHAPTPHLPELNQATSTPASEPANMTEPVEIEPHANLVERQKSELSAPLMNLVVHDAPIKEVLFGIARDSGVNMDIHPGLQGRITLHAIKTSLPALLARMAKQVDMRYQWLNGVWNIAPDTPVVRSYRLNYVNINRDTTAFIGAASEISGGMRTANASLNTSLPGQANTGQGNTNSSRTAVSSQSRHHLWETVVQNLQALLEETDKSLLAQRYGLSSETLHVQSSPTLKPSSASQKSESASTEMATEAPNPNLTPASIEPNVQGAVSSPNSKVETALINTALATETEAQREQKRQEYSRLLSAKVIANPETGILAVRATQRQHQQVKTYLESVMRVATRQVLIEATIVEVELGQGYQRGIDWSRLSGATPQRGWIAGQSLGSKAAEFSSSTGSFSSNNSKNALGENNSSVAFLLGYLHPIGRLGNLAATVTLLEQFGRARVLSSPKLMVLNNQTAMLKVVDNLVYFTIQSQISQSTGTASSNLQSVTTTANTVPVGLVMAVTAQINSQSQVSLSVRPTVSKVLRYISDPNPQLGAGNGRIVSSIPEIQVREMESVLSVNSGQVAVLGGLMQDEQRDLTDRVPGLGQLPIVGYAFSGQNRASKKTELVVFIRPTVIRHADVVSGDLQAFQGLLPNQQASPAQNSDAMPLSTPSMP